MKKKSLVLALAMLALVGCDSKKDDVEKANIDTQSQMETASENDELIYDDEIKQNTKDSEKDYKEESIESTINNPSIDEIVRNKSTVDVGDFTDNQIMNAYNNPNSMYEQYLSDSMYWYEVPENQVKDAIKSIISADFEYAKELGVSFESLPIYYAIDRETYKVREDVYSRGKAGSMIGFDINGVHIRDFNSFLYPEIANDYRLMLSLMN